MFAVLPMFQFGGRRFVARWVLHPIFRKNDQLVAKIESRMRLVVAGNERLERALQTPPILPCVECATVAFEYHGQLDLAQTQLCRVVRIDACPLPRVGDVWLFRPPASTQPCS